jgi:hypothetical protein
MTARTLKIEDAIRSGAEVPNIRRLLKSNEVRVIEDADGFRKVLLDDGMVITSYARLGKITARQHEAGTIFAKWCFVALGSGVKSQSFEISCGGTGDISEARLMARGKLGMARERLGEAYYSVLESVCWGNHAATDWAAGRNMHPACGPAFLKAALELFADDRGLQPDPI